MGNNKKDLRTDLRIRVKWAAEVGDKKMSGIEEEASWLLFDQAGGSYTSGPFKPIQPIGDEYTEFIPLIKIKDKYLSVKEIEGYFEDFTDLVKMGFAAKYPLLAESVKRLNDNQKIGVDLLPIDYELMELFSLDDIK